MANDIKELARILEEDVGLGPGLFNGQEQIVQWQSREGNNSFKTDRNLDIAMSSVEDLVGTISDEEIDQKLRAILAELEKIFHKLRNRPKVEGNEVEPMYNDCIEHIIVKAIKTLEHLRT